MTRMFVLASVLLLAAFAAQTRQPEFPELAGPYLGQKPPGAVPELFAPGIVSKEGHQSKLLVSPDGNEIIFQTMALTPGSGTSPAERRIRFESVRSMDGKWQPPVVIPFSLEFVNDEPALSSDGQTLFFASNRPEHGDSAAKKLPDIWMARKNGMEWGEPRNLGSPVNTDGVEAQPFYSSDDKLYFGAVDGMYFSRCSEGRFADPVKLEGKAFQERARGLRISPGNDVLIVHSNAPGGYGSWDLYCSFRDADGSWTELINMGDAINTDQSEGNATFSPDGKYLFFSRGDDIYWVSAEAIEKLKKVPN